MKHISKCPFCKLMKENVEWNFAGDIGCKDCANNYFKSLLGNTRRK